MFYLIVLLFALSWRLVSADSRFSGISGIAVEELDGETGIVFSLTHVNRPAVSYSGEDKCLVLDFKDASVADKLVDKAFSGRDLRLGYVTTLPQNHGNARVRLYLRPGCLASIRYSGSDVIVRIAEKTAMAATATVEPGLLLSPAEEKYAPVVISLHDAQLLPVITELAEIAGLQIEISGNLPARFTLEAQSDSPIDAMRNIARACDLDLIRRGQVCHISPRDSEKPKIYAYSGDLLQ
jgi:hypothetical protein